MKRPFAPSRGRTAGPSQRQLRAGELIRHALVDILRDEGPRDPALDGVSVTVTEARMSADLKHVHVFVQPLGGGDPKPVVDALNRSAKYLRGQLGRQIDMRFTPDLTFRHDESFEAAARMDKLFANPHIRMDLDPKDEDEPDGA